MGADKGVEYDDDWVDVYIVIPKDLDYVVYAELEFMGATIYTVGGVMWAICHDNDQYDYVQDMINGY